MELNRAFKLIAASAFCAAGSACASLNAPPNKSVVAPPQSSDQGIMQLEPRNMTMGQCGLFVWSADAQKRFVLFSQDIAGRSAWHDGISEHVLLRELSGDETDFGISPIQSFTTESGAALTLELSGAQEIESGTRYKSGLLRVTETQGWERITPVIGLAACRP